MRSTLIACSLSIAFVTLTSACQMAEQPPGDDPAGPEIASVADPAAGDPAGTEDRDPNLADGLDAQSWCYLANSGSWGCANNAQCNNRCRNGDASYGYAYECFWSGNHIETLCVCCE